MLPEDRIVVACTRTRFSSSHQQLVLDLCRAVEIDWERVHRTALQHRVDPLVNSNLQQCDLALLNIPPSVAERFENAFYRNIMMKHLMRDRLIQALELLSDRGLEVMVIKGAAADYLVYEDAWSTGAGDVDIVIRARRADLGARKSEEIDNSLDDLRLSWGKDQRKNLLEWDYFEHHDVTMNGILPVNFQAIWERATEIEIAGQRALVMCLEDSLLAACINACRKRYFRLKSLLDIAETVQKYPDLDWDALADRAKAYRCNTIVYTALAVTKQLLGCKFPETLFGALRVHPLRATMIELASQQLLQRVSLQDAVSPTSGATILGRRPTFSLVLTYTSYRLDQLLPKAREILRARQALC